MTRSATDEAKSEVTVSAPAGGEITAAPAGVEPTSPRPQEPATVVVPEPRKRFDLFIIDVGWKSPVAESLRSNLDKCFRFQHNSTIYMLSPEQCVQFFRNHPASIGTEPSVIVIDREAYAARRPQGYGFKLNLGLIRDVPTANNLVKWVLAVLAEQKPGSDITEPIRTVIHKEGIRGAIDILADMARSPVGEAVTH
jgi:hypothetical protein